MREDIIRLKREGNTHLSIATELGCSKSTVSYHLSEDQRIRAKARSIRHKTDICSCGAKKSKRSPLCMSCSLIAKREVVLSKTREQYHTKAKNNHKFLNIRKHASDVMARKGLEKKCALCDFNAYVEVCHIKAISSFNDSSLISEINHPDNLVYLCPNHHILFDRGLINL